MTTQADLLDLANAPLFLSGNVKPNVFFVLDDSGSMDWEVLAEEHWHYCAYDPHATSGFSSSDCGWWVTERLFRSYGNWGYRWFEYIYDANDNQYGDNCFGQDGNAIMTCPQAGEKDWRVFTSSVNVTYYSPDTLYAPWVGECLTDGTSCQNAAFTQARSNPRQGTTGYTDQRDLTGFKYDIWIDDRGYTGSRPHRGSNVNATTTPNQEVDLWDTHVRITLNANEALVQKISYNPDSSGMQESVSLMATLNNTNACYNALGASALVKQMAQGSLSFTSTNAPGCKTLAQAKTNAANWYEYHRRRSHAAKNVIGSILGEYPDFRYGLSALNLFSTLFSELPLVGASLSNHNDDLLNALYDLQIQPLGTPLRRGLERAGLYYNQSLLGQATSPIISACQQNFTVLITDGFWNGYSPWLINSDYDGDGISGTLADVARYFYTHDLSPLEDLVPSNPFDDAKHQHMVSFMVALGVRGELNDTDDDGWPNPELGVSSDWGNPYYSETAKIDDLWHAAYNSAGIFTSAQYPSEITSKLFQVLQNISERVTSASSVAQNSTTLETNSQVYQARFNSLSWEGELLAYSINLEGEIAQSPNWNAGCKLTGGSCSLPALEASENPGIDPNDRVIITRAWNNSQEGVPFRWPNDYTSYQNNGALPTRLSDFLAHAPYDPNSSNGVEISNNQSYGEALVDYLRGVRTQEIQNAGTYAFRDRSSILGDIIHSDPLFVDKPLRFYPDDLENAPYSTFKSTYANRPAVIYSGANDGMLHGFLASSGEEVLAYVPGHREIYEKLPELSQQNYVHQYFVDGSPNENDVYVNGWRTVLAAGLRHGAQGIFALDITDPSQFTEANADDIFMFEFSDEEDADLGYIYGQISIAKIKTSASPQGEWALIFGNGYNNTASDGHASTTGKAYLFILPIEHGLDGTWSADDYIKIPVGTGDVTTPNGLGAPYVVDIDGDYVVDYIYAGDLKGTLWKFDVTQDDPDAWEATAFFEASFATQGDQPITSRPIVGTHPLGIDAGVMVYFGTGKYLESDDNNPTGATTQTFYGLWDKLDGTLPTKSSLLQQSILNEITVAVDSDGDGSEDSDFEYRQVSDHAINWQAPLEAGDPSQHLGWYLNLEVDGSLNNLGEKQIFQALLRNGNIIFTTILPSQSPCDFGGDSWLMELNRANGGQPSKTVFDVNQDGIFTSADYILIPNDGNPYSVPASGQKSKAGITPTPAVFMTQSKDKEVKVLSGSTGLETVAENPETGESGRRNWRQIQ